jgi:hypothetical protein
MHGDGRHFAVNARLSEEVIDVTAHVHIGAHIRNARGDYPAIPRRASSGVWANQDSDGNSLQVATDSPSTADHLTV